MKFNLPSIKITPNIWQALAVVALIAGLILMLAFLRRTIQKHESHYGIWSGIAAGFIIALVLEGFLLMNGKSTLTSILKAKNMPAPIQNLLDSAHKELFDILQISEECRNNF